MEQRGDESTGETIACADGVSHLYDRSGEERDLARREDITTISATSKDQKFEGILAEDDPALVLEIYSGISEHLANETKFFIIDLHDIATRDQSALRE